MSKCSMGRHLQKTIQVLSPGPRNTFLSLLCCISEGFTLLSIVAGICWYENALKSHQKKITWFSYKSLLSKNDRFSIFFSLLLKPDSKGRNLLQIFFILICLIETLVLYNLVSKNQLGMDVLVFEILVEILHVQFRS